MKHFLLKKCLLLLIPIIGMGFVACNDNASDLPVEYIQSPKFHAEIRVKNVLSDGHSGRAAGPSTEDGIFEAFEHENHVYNATIFFYRNEKGIQGEAGTKMDYAVYIPLFSSRKEGLDYYVYYTPQKIHCEEPIAKGNYHILIVCNLGDKTSWKDTKTLGEIRNEVVAKAYIQNEGAALNECHSFVMASSEDQMAEIGELNLSTDPDNPNTSIIGLQANVERLAARIDFAADQGVWKENVAIGAEGNPVVNAYEYQVEDAPDDLFYLTSVVPVNLYNGNEYLIKRASRDNNPQSNQLRDYLTGETGNTNYVLDPLTLGTKTTAMYDNPLADWYSVDNLERIKKCTSAYPVTRYDETKPTLCYEVTDNDNGTSVKRKYQVLAYTKENTILAGSPKEKFVTGLVFSGYYKRVEKEANDTESVTWVPKAYVYYIRHNDPFNTSAENVPMKYGIVRNHIYRIRLKGVNNLGIIFIEVVDWRLIKAPEIDM